MHELRGNSVLILGYGREGRATLNFLRKHFPDLKVAVADRSSVALESGHDSVTLYSGDNYLDALDDFDTIVRSPGIPPHLAQIARASARGRLLTSLTNLFMSLAPGKVIAVTGTKGKSTTASLIAHLLAERYSDLRLVGNIGKPALDYLEGAGPDTVFVLECSSFQLEDLRYAPQTAVFLNVVPEHLDYHHTFEAYFRAKSNIALHQTPEQILISNPDYSAVRSVIHNSPARKFFFSSSRTDGCTAFLSHDTLYLREHSGMLNEVLPASALPILGPGNIQNALAAVTTASVHGADSATISRRLKSFEPLPNRLEQIGTFRQVQFINDSLATIPQATINALHALGPAVRTLICGGHDRGLDYTVLGKALVKSGVKHLILFPSTGKKIWRACIEADYGFDQRCAAHAVDDMQKAVSIAYEVTPPGAICLMSPAASSLNLFRDYQERGDLFRKFVQELADTSGT